MSPTGFCSQGRRGRRTRAGTDAPAGAPRHRARRSWPGPTGRARRVPGSSSSSRRRALLGRRARRGRRDARPDLDGDPTGDLVGLVPRLRREAGSVGRRWVLVHTGRSCHGHAQQHPQDGDVHRQIGVALGRSSAARRGHPARAAAAEPAGTATHPPDQHDNPHSTAPAGPARPACGRLSFLRLPPGLCGAAPPRARAPRILPQALRGKHRGLVPLPGEPLRPLRAALRRRGEPTALKAGGHRPPAPASRDGTGRPR